MSEILFPRDFRVFSALSFRLSISFGSRCDHLRFAFWYWLCGLALQKSGGNLSGGDVSEIFRVLVLVGEEIDGALKMGVGWDGEAGSAKGSDVVLLSEVRSWR